MGQYAPRTPSRPQRVLEVGGLVRTNYVEASDLPRWLSTSTEHPLAIVSFGISVRISAPCPIITLDLPQLGGRQTVEVWSCDQPVTVHRNGDFRAAMNSDVCFGAMHVEESPTMGLRQATEQAYRRLLDEMRRRGFLHLWRIWNYFPAINEQEQGLERYRQFCVGRHQALADQLAGFPATVPAGTAVGTKSGPLQIHVLAGTRPATHLGNPRQVHAYEYPEQYGPCSPSFARATLCRFEMSPQLLLAGTASVVGHQSQHPGQPQAQAQETVDNIRALIGQVEGTSETSIADEPWRGYYKVYVREPEHLPAIQQALHDPLFASNRTIYLHSDLCRRELLVEIEGLMTID